MYLFYNFVRFFWHASVISLLILLQERLLKTHSVKTKLLSSSTLTIMTPEVLLEVFRISWAKETAKKKREKRLLEGGIPAEKIRGDDDEEEEEEEKEENGDSDSEEMNITDEALIASNAVMNSFLREVVHRAAAAAEEDGDSSVNGVHLERILPQLLLDFTS